MTFVLPLSKTFPKNLECNRVQASRILLLFFRTVEILAEKWYHICNNEKGCIQVLKKFKNINIRVLISHLIVTLAYPAVKAYVSESSRLLVFTDAVTVIAYILIIGGIVYSLYLHGDFDISGFFLKRGMKSDENKNFDTYMTDRKEKREAAFNYPLFLGIVYLVAAVVISYCFL